MPVDDGNARKKEYIITNLGKSIADEELTRLKELSMIAEVIIGEGSVKSFV